MSTYVSVVISPATTTRPVVIRVSQATRPLGSSCSTASSTVSEIWSATLSGWPSVTDSDVKRNSRAAIRRLRLLDLEECVEGLRVAGGRAPREEGAQRTQVRGHAAADVAALERSEALEQRDRVLEVDVDEAARRVGQAGRGLRLREIGPCRELLARDARACHTARCVGDHDLPGRRAVADREVPEVDRPLG